MNDNPFIPALKKAFRSGLFTPNDMLATLGKLK
jgi:hypothetical protein